MKVILKSLILVIMIVTISEAQPKVVSFKKIREFLPTIELKGFERSKPEGRTQTAMGFSTSEATVRYLSTNAVENDSTAKDTSNINNSSQKRIEIVVKISDMIAIPGATLGLSYMQDFVNETDDAYEKTVLIHKTFKGKETGTNGNIKSCNLEFVVRNRFLINVEVHGSDNRQLIYALVDTMRLQELEKLQPEEDN
jgi:hypothetical protein